MNQLFNGRSIQERGTLCQLKAYFNHRNATTDVMNSFNDTENFIRFVTEAHIVYAAMHKLGLHNIDGIPTTSDGKKPKADRKRYLQELCDDLVDSLWCVPSSEEVNSLLETDSVHDHWCICKEGKYLFILINLWIILSVYVPLFI